ncbi:MAG: extracellular solute-binding protein [Limnochordia bacterium]|nr:extracellular solute-binding protein [Limnochordia bacterium]
MIPGSLPESIEPLKISGNTYGVPAIGPENWVITRNRSMFSEAGLEDRSPETWREMVDVSKKLTKWDGDKLSQMGLELNIRGETMYYCLLYAAGGNVFSEDGTRALLDSATSEEVLAFARDFYETAYKGFTAVPEFLATVADNFYTGRRAMDCLSAAPIYWLKSLDYTLDLGYGPIPVPEDSGRKAQAVLRPGWSYSVCKTGDDRKQEAAYLLAEWLSAAEEGGNWLCRISGMVSPVIEANFHEEYLEEIADWEQFVTLAVEGVPMETSAVRVDSPAGHMWRTVLNGSASPQEAAELAQFEAQKALDEYYTKNR